MIILDFSLQASEEYREHSSHKTRQAKKTKQSQQQHVVEQHSSSVQESVSVTKRSTTKDSSQKKFNVVRLNNIPLPSTTGKVTCEYFFLIIYFIYLSKNPFNNNLFKNFIKLK